MKTYRLYSAMVEESASCTCGQLPDGHSTLFPGESLLVEQYAAEAYCSMSLNLSSKSDAIPRPCRTGAALLHEAVSRAVVMSDKRETILGIVNVKW